jgi:hypothetical protein
VSGSNGENTILARGVSQAEAWHRAAEQAEADLAELVDEARNLCERLK